MVHCGIIDSAQMCVCVCLQVFMFINLEIWPIFGWVCVAVMCVYECVDLNYGIALTHWLLLSPIHHSLTMERDCFSSVCEPEGCLQDVLCGTMRIFIMNITALACAKEERHPWVWLMCVCERKLLVFLLYLYWERIFPSNENISNTK